MSLQLNDYLLFIFLAAACFTDIKHRKLPNWLTLTGMAVGLSYHLITSGIEGIFFSGLGLIVGGGIFFVLYLFKALGAGDVKLFAGIGALVGVELVLYFMMYSIVFAGIIAIIILLFTRTFLRKITTAFFSIIGSIMSKDLSEIENFKANKSTQFPFMYAVIPAVIISYSFFTTL
ncbi:A24 family peptidase [Evansella halocellulosilytica]|uniref:A24 family peptidase n=1 Tax=Evansella halocellulosilytica TaxID=2011013 RepID=UPI000BB70C79|nr:A24 family peptidase [Evansella halocellulosilytica]